MWVTNDESYYEIKFRHALHVGYPMIKLIMNDLDEFQSLYVSLSVSFRVMTLTSGISKRKSRKLSKKESRIRCLQRIPALRRWWYLWQSSSSETVSTVVSEPPCGNCTELIWSRGHFQKNIIRWMTEIRDSELVSPNIF